MLVRPKAGILDPEQFIDRFLRIEQREVLDAAFEVTKKLGSYQRKAVLQKVSVRLENLREEFGEAVVA